MDDENLLIKTLSNKLLFYLQDIILRNNHYVKLKLFIMDDDR